MTMSTSGRPQLVVTVVASALAAVTLAGCQSGGSSATPSAPTAGASTGVSAASATVISAGATSSPGGGVVSSSASPSSAALTLGDKGIGGLGLGMPMKKALATGLVGKVDKELDNGPEGCQAFHGKRGISLVYFHAGRVEIIAVGRSIRLDTGIGVGDTYRALHRKYPEATDGGAADGRLYAPAPGARIKASYRFGINTEGAFPNSKITEIALQGNDQTCYE
jgi:hypothetical protein